jgi:hypothetical protein
VKVNKELYADGIDRIHFAGGMVRYDFVSVEPTQAESAFSASARIVMPPQGFLNMFNSMQELINKLVEAGVLQKNTPPQSGGMPITDAVIIEEEKDDVIKPEAVDTPKKKAAKKSKK